MDSTLNISPNLYARRLLRDGDSSFRCGNLSSAEKCWTDSMKSACSFTCFDAGTIFTAGGKLAHLYHSQNREIERNVCIQQAIAAYDKVFSSEEHPKIKAMVNSLHAMKSVPCTESRKVPPIKSTGNSAAGKIIYSKDELISIRDSSSHGTTMQSTGNSAAGKIIYSKDELISIRDSSSHGTTMQSTGNSAAGKIIYSKDELISIRDSNCQYHLEPPLYREVIVSGKRGQRKRNMVEGFCASIRHTTNTSGNSYLSDTERLGSPSEGNSSVTQACSRNTTGCDVVATPSDIESIKTPQPAESFQINDSQHTRGASSATNALDKWAADLSSGLAQAVGDDHILVTYDSADDSMERNEVDSSDVL